MHMVKQLDVRLIPICYVTYVCIIHWFVFSRRRLAQCKYWYDSGSGHLILERMPISLSHSYTLVSGNFLARNLALSDNREQTIENPQYIFQLIMTSVRFA